MRNWAKTYREFITEAYVDPEGRLHDLEFTQKELYDLEIVDHLNQIGEFLEDSGATRVRLIDYDKDPIEFSFEYGQRSYFMEFNLDDDTIVIYSNLGRDGTPQEIYRDSAQSFFDLVAHTGLDFLML